MERIQVQLTDEQLEKVRTLAEQRGVSISEVVRRAVDALGAVPSRLELRQRALSIIGQFSSGDRDVATKHDDYAAEAFDRRDAPGRSAPSASRRRSKRIGR